MNRNLDLMDIAAGTRSVKVYTFKKKYDSLDFVPYEVKKQLKKKKLREAK